MLYQLIYSSKASAAVTLAGLQGILVDARAGNEARNITGALIFIDGYFLQVLEGEKDTVIALIRSIITDSRHTDVKVIHEMEVDHRMFGTWRTAYVDATAEQLSDWAGLPGAASIDVIVQDLERDSTRTGQVARSILRALVP
jgi:hypothetical protein